MSYNATIILNEILTNSTFTITRANCGLFRTSDEWSKIKEKIRSIPKDCQLIYLEGWIKRRREEDNEKESEDKKEQEKRAREKREREERDKKARDDRVHKEREERIRKEREEHEEKIFKECKEREERNKRERKERMDKEYNEYKEREKKDREEREKREREEREKRDREEREKRDREERESSVARHTLFAHYGPGLAFAVPTPGYPGRHLVHMGGGTFIPSAAPIGFIAPGFIPGPCFVRAHRF